MPPGNNAPPAHETCKIKWRTGDGKDTLIIVPPARSPVAPLPTAHVSMYTHHPVPCYWCGAQRAGGTWCCGSRGCGVGEGGGGWVLNLPVITLPATLRPITPCPYPLSCVSCCLLPTPPGTCILSTCRKVDKGRWPCAIPAYPYRVIQCYIGVVWLSCLCWLCLV